jgi:hypothetical protein
MKENTLVAVFDRAGSECVGRYHFVIGKKDDAMAGGIYISKIGEIPESLTVVFKRTDDLEVTLAAEAERKATDGQREGCNG